MPIVIYVKRTTNNNEFSTAFDFDEWPFNVLPHYEC